MPWPTNERLDEPILFEMFQKSTRNSITAFSSRSNNMQNLTATCNVNCICESVQFNPVCGLDKITYFSPCHLGCIKKISKTVSFLHYTTFLGLCPSCTHSKCNNHVLSSSCFDITFKTGLFMAFENWGNMADFTATSSVDMVMKL